MRCETAGWVVCSFSAAPRKLRKGRDPEEGLMVLKSIMGLPFLIRSETYQSRSEMTIGRK